MKSVINALSFDVEEYFQVTAFNDYAPYHEWDRYERRAHLGAERILSILEKAETRATFFIVGWVAEKNPHLVKTIWREGHEIACHSYAHQRVYQQTPQEFREDVRRAKRILEDIIGEPVRGYRAPTFSITTPTFWALDVLMEEGFGYDSSIFPILHDRYGVPEAERFPNVIRRNNGHRLLEFPMSTIRLVGRNLPFAGGGYMRLLPVGFISHAIRRINRGGHPAIIYVHPWELDPDQPRILAPTLTMLRHYTNISTMSRKLERLLKQHRFAPVGDVVKSCG